MSGQPSVRRRTSSPEVRRLFWLIGAVSIITTYLATSTSYLFESNASSVPFNAQEILARCQQLNVKPAPSPDFHNREYSDRSQEGTYPVLLKNATIWTGRVNGYEVVKGDLLLDKGIIQSVGHVAAETIEGIQVVDVKGAWITPGIVDLHSHMGDEPSPQLHGSADGNSFKGPIVPWLRSLDALNTHDESYRLAAAGGVTTSLILPGSANAIGGQAFVVKTRPTKEGSPTSMLLEPPNANNTHHWRHMKHACGENPARLYSGTRMDTVWATRQAYDKARQIKRTQDDFCTKASSGQWEGLGDFPDDLQWDAMVDILRGKVKVQTHCYEAVDIDRFVSLSNEFQFPVAAFHHAHEAYLVPEVMKKAFEHPPAAAMFASFSRYKREAYRHSEYAPRVLDDAGIKVVMKSDHSAIVSRYLLHEAQQAHYYGLASNIALASVISTPAEVMGLDHRIGFIKPGYDADIVVWDSHPLALGATPTQVYIDGIPQIEKPVVLQKSASAQHPPIVPSFEAETESTLAYTGLPPIDVDTSSSDTVVFRNVSSVWMRYGWDVRKVFSRASVSDEGTVVVRNGAVECYSECDLILYRGRVVEINLDGGSISPALVSTGSSIGLQAIAMEDSTTDDSIVDVLSGKVPSMLNGEVIQAVDGLQFGTRNALLAYRAGVSSSITAPGIGNGHIAGLSVSFSLGAGNKLQSGAVLQDGVALHVALHRGLTKVSVSTQIAALRRLLLGLEDSKLGEAFKAASKGAIPLVVQTNNADIMATVLALKAEVETFSKHEIRLVFVGAAEAHLVVSELQSASVGIVLTPPRSFPYTWDHRRTLPGPPLTQSVIDVLAKSNITLAIGPQGIEGASSEPAMESWAVRNLRFDAGWVMMNSNGTLSYEDALAMASTNVEKLLGVTEHAANTDLVATRGGDLLSFESKVVATISPRRGLVDLLAK